MSDRPDLEAAADELRRTDALPPLVLTMTRAEALQLVAQLQLALRHPKNTGRSAQWTREFARRFEKSFEGFPAVQKLIAAGWNPESDR
jgi:hypothetical protein